MAKHSEQDIENLFNESYAEESEFDRDENLEPLISIDLDEVNEQSSAAAENITERLSGYFFDEIYIKDHPYVKNKINQEMNNIRRLLKMLAINEKAQDALIQNISINGSKGNLYLSLTSLQKAMLDIQKQLNDLTSALEDIFRAMQEECEKTFAEKDKEEMEDGTMTVRGSRDFIKELTARMEARQKKEEPKQPIQLELAL